MCIDVLNKLLPEFHTGILLGGGRGELTAKAVIACIILPMHANACILPRGFGEFFDLLRLLQMQSGAKFHSIIVCYMYQRLW